MEQNNIILNNNTEIELLINNKLNNVLGDIDETRQIISLYGSVLNKINCTNTPNCTLLNRYECNDKSYTCGKCKIGYIGDEGSNNNLCLLNISLLNVNNNNKECINNCNNNGKCIYINKNTLKTINECKINDITCDIKCICNNNYIGDNCNILKSELSITINIRSTLISNLLSLTTNEDQNTESISSWVSNVILLSEKKEELSISSSNTILDI
ncbi:MAG: hypothetical protein AAB284_00905, partial [Chloroflexota bacterium]